MSLHSDIDCYWGLSSNWTENRVKHTLALHEDAIPALRSPFLGVPIPHLTSFNDFLPVFAQFTVRSDMSVERLPGNTQFAAQVGHLRFLLPHGSHG